MKQSKTANRTLTRDICMTAVFAALTCAATFILVPLPFGYFNLGDIVLLCAAWMLGPVLGAAAAVGAALADLLAGFAMYAPATLVIKAAMAVCAALLFRILRPLIPMTASRVISAFAAEGIMIAGYFLYEAAVLGLGAGAAASIPGNVLQAICGIIGAALLMTTLSANKRVAQFFRLT